MLMKMKSPQQKIFVFEHGWGTWNRGSALKPSVSYFLFLT